ncbi:glycosyltransferase family 117 protein [Siphonobacter curvatus]|uniref:DUF2723 domain-containing protein n=1 Tax=Siphonobacter curvatus TaxID=2094562 RepID=A0A2S7INA7_9BACT|nr:DUF2723 domain-containing protein [Siphonobacter curvatus]PQA59088.1 DUF2723 domain-containing protein [Siphonobacter curvatus]
MKNFLRINTWLGWGMFAVAFFTYAFTVEPTASFWDCGEFIACSYKLQVPHPPGAPIFLILGRLFSLLAGSDHSQVAYWVNMVSVLASAGTILFMFWTLTLLGRKVIGKTAATVSASEAIGIFGAGLVGALLYTFSDSFWFSAVETEVYALSSFLIALVFWAMLRWELIEEEAAANRWLILVAYLTGISIGIHLVNLVILPALTLVYYHRKKQNPSFLQSIGAVLVGVLLVGLINGGMLSGLGALAFATDRLLVNSFGFPFHSGVVVWLLLVFGALGYGVYFAQQRKRPVLSTALLSVLFILIGYGSYTSIVIRSNFHTPINENNPSDLINYLHYLNRDQYGSRSLLYGPQFTARVTDFKRGKPQYKTEGTRYQIYDYEPAYIWEKDQQSFLPRMGSQLPGHADLYAASLGLVKDPTDPSRYQKPTFFQNLQYMFSRQMGFMYMRYFLWNFVGRESDQLWADWYPRLGKSVALPESIRTNKGHDNFYYLPLMLGLMGFFTQFTKGDKDWLVIAVAFLMTGLALVFFLNAPPVEPRERDYIYAGSFYFFALWAGLGVLTLQNLVQKITKHQVLAGSLAGALALGVPVLMGAKSWDNHDRSHRYTAVDFARNLLSSCAPNAILFTGGDNDTFPLWYVQEVEGFRKDVRVCCLSLLGTEWYIQQMKEPADGSEPLPISLAMDNFRTGINDQIIFSENPNVKEGIDLTEYLKLVRENNPAIQAETSLGTINVLPSRVFSLKLDRDTIQKSGVVAKGMEPLFTEDRMTWDFGTNDIIKDRLIQLDIIAQNQFKRPVYFASTLSSANYLGLKEFMQIEGYAYRLMPFKVAGATDGFVNTELMYDKMMHKMAWRGMNNPDVYHDDTIRGIPVVSARLAFYRLSTQLIQEGKLDTAKAALHRCLEVMPDQAIPYDQISASFIGPLISVGEKQKALEMAQTMMKRCDENLNYYFSSNGDAEDIRVNLFQMNRIVQQLREAKLETLAQNYETTFERQYQKFERRFVEAE